MAVQTNGMLPMGHHTAHTHNESDTTEGSPMTITASRRRFRTALPLLTALGCMLAAPTALAQQLLPNEPKQFDFESRTGFPLAWDDRAVSVEEFINLVDDALAGNRLPDEVRTDWELMRDRYLAHAAPGRSDVRVVRVYSDQPVYVVDGVAILPDPTTPEGPLGEPSEELRADLCETETLGSPRCVSLHRDHEENKQVGALLLVARNVIIKGISSTNGLSLFTMTENLSMKADSYVDLSARQDRPPTLGVTGDYRAFEDLDGSPGATINIYDEILRDDVQAEPGPGNEWRFPPEYADLQWQLDAARQQVPDYEWDVDPCDVFLEDNTATCGAINDIDECWRKREPRGLAGRPGGDWFALTFRSTTTTAVSRGQPGGNGGPGLAACEDISCGGAGVKPQFCSWVPAACSAEQCAGVDTNPNDLCNCDQAPASTDVCDCTSCEVQGCTVQYEEDNPGDCDVTCQMSPFAHGSRGGQAGPGGAAGLIRIVSAVRMNKCSAFNPESTTNPELLHSEDERCLEDEACSSDPECYDNPSVMVCEGSEPDDFAPFKNPYREVPGAIEIIEAIGEYAEEVEEVPGAPDPTEIQLFNPILDSPNTTLVNVGGGQFLELAPSEEQTIPAIATATFTPHWAPSGFVNVPLSLFREGPRRVPRWADFGFRISNDVSASLRLSRFWPGLRFLAWRRHVRRVRRAIIEANPQFAHCAGRRCDELSGIYLRRLARTVRSPAARTAAEELASAAGPVTENTRVQLTFQKEFILEAPSLVLRSGGGTSASRRLDFENGDFDIDSAEVLCVDDAFSQHIVFSGQPGEPGAGGLGAEERCLGLAATIPIICRNTSGEDCSISEEPRPICNGELERCFTQYEFPEEFGDCRPGWEAIPYGQAIDYCPGASNTFGKGGVECEAPDGLDGASTERQTDWPLAGVTAWARSDWARALHVVHPLELRRRAGRADTLFKRGERLPALARYLATETVTRDNFWRNVAVCTPDSCFFCDPDNPELAPTPELRSLCEVYLEVEARTGHLAAGWNYYGYGPNYVPPVSLATSSPFGGDIDLVSQTRAEIERARGSRDSWIGIGQRLRLRADDKQFASLTLQGQIDALDDQLEPAGSLTLAATAAEAKVEEHITALEELRTEIEALKDLKVNLAESSAGLFDVNFGDLAGWAASAGAMAYLGPVGATLAGDILSFSGNKPFIHRGRAFAQYDALRKIAAAKQEPYSPDFFSRVDFDGAEDVFFEELLKKLKVGDIFDTLLKETLLGMGLRDEKKAKNNIKQLVVDLQLRDLTLRVHETSRALGQSILEAYVARAKFREAKRQRLRAQRDLQVVNNAPSGGAFPAAEVQYQIADLALLNGAAAVERAGETFFLLRQGAERDTIPISTTATNELSGFEQAVIDAHPGICGDISGQQLDINLKNLECYDLRVDSVQSFTEARLSTRTLSILEESDTNLAFGSGGDWDLIQDSEGTEWYVSELVVLEEEARRGFRSNHTKHKIEDITFFLETDDSDPALVPISVSRPVTQQDSYILGAGPNGLLFLNYDAAVARPSGNALEPFLRDTTTYAEDAFACNGLGTQDPRSGSLALCQLSELDPGPFKRAFLEGLSLVGGLDLAIRVEDLGGRQPTRLFAEYLYSYEPE